MTARELDPVAEIEDLNNYLEDRRLNINKRSKEDKAAFLYERT